MGERVAVLGASDDPARYAFKAQAALIAHGHDVVPVNPHLQQVAGRRCVATLAEAGAIDTITVYLRAELSEPLGDDIVRSRPKRVIFNPGAESRPLERTLESAGIRVQRACTLVLLASGRYED